MKKILRILRIKLIKILNNYKFEFKCTGLTLTKSTLLLRQLNTAITLIELQSLNRDGDKLVYLQTIEFTFLVATKV